MSSKVEAAASPQSDAASAPTGATKSRYNSPSIAARRARVLREARALIFEHGLDFNIRDLANRASVGAGTVYYLFSSKDELVAHVLSDYIHEHAFSASAAQTFDFTSIESMIAALEASMANNMQTSFNLVRAVDALFYAEATAAHIRRIIRNARAQKYQTLLTALKACGDLLPWVRADFAGDDLAIQDGAIVHEWCTGNMGYEEFRLRRLLGFSNAILALTCGASRARAEGSAESYTRALNRLHRSKA